MPKKRKATEGYVIDVGHVTPFVVYEGREPIQAFHTLDEAVSHFPTATVTDGAKRKAGR